MGYIVQGSFHLVYQNTNKIFRGIISIYSRDIQNKPRKIKTYTLNCKEIIQIQKKKKYEKELKWHLSLKKNLRVSQNKKIVTGLLSINSISILLSGRHKAQHRYSQIRIFIIHQS